MGDITKNFQNAIFHLKANKEFILDIPDKSYQIKSATWSYNETQKTVSIRGKDPMGNIGLLMKIVVRMERSVCYFILEESPLALQVNKKFTESN